MCVIIVAKSKVLRPALFVASERINPHGAGITWQSKSGRVRVEKGLGWEEVYKIHKNAPFPQMIHFRAASSGGAGLLLNHPFPITERAELEYSGEYDAVLAHNGHSHIAEMTVDRLMPFLWEGAKEEPWSDSRALAYLVYKFGREWLAKEAAGQRIGIHDINGIHKLGAWDLDLTNLALSINIVSWARGELLDEEDQIEYDNRKYEKFDWDGFDAQMLKSAQGHGNEE